MSDKNPDPIGGTIPNPGGGTTDSDDPYDVDTKIIGKIHRAIGEAQGAVERRRRRLTKLVTPSTNWRKRFHEKVRAISMAAPVGRLCPRVSSVPIAPSVAAKSRFRPYVFRRAPSRSTYSGPDRDGTPQPCETSPEFAPIPPVVRLGTELALPRDDLLIEGRCIVVLFAENRRRAGWEVDTASTVRRRTRR
jgi:hypothetical protein